MAYKILSATELKLLSLVTTERNGREVAKLYRKETGKPVSYGTLYTTFRRLRERGWVKMRGDRGSDGRIRFFLITTSGARALEQARSHYAALSRFATATVGT